MNEEPLVGTVTKQRRSPASWAALLLIGGVGIWWLTHSANDPAATTEATAAGVPWLTDYEAALAQARSDGKQVVVDFYADWCAPCKMMERETFTDTRVQSRVAGLVPLKIDVDQHEELARRYSVTGLPTTLVLHPDGQPVTGAVGFLGPEKFVQLLDAAAQKQQPRHGILGQPAPELDVATWFNLPASQQTVRLSDYRGKVVYLYGFQSWCPGCHRQGFPTLTKLIKHYAGNDDVAFLAVQTTFEGFHANGPEDARKTVQRYNLTIPVGHSGSRDEPSSVMQRYRTGGTPWTVIIGRDGVVRYNDFHIQPEAAVKLIENLLAGKGG